MDALKKAAAKYAGRFGAQALMGEARALYDACVRVGTRWEQLGPVTQSVWLDKALLKLSGVECWWSINPDGALIIHKAASGPGIRAATQEYLKMDINKKVADQLDAISEAFSALSATFRSGSGSGESGGGDEAPTKPVRGSRTKPAATTPAKKAKADAVELTQDDVRDALRELVELRGKEVMVQALESVGAGKLADVDESQYQELMDNINELKEEPAEAPAPAKGKRTPTKKPAGPTLDDVTEAAKALIAADKPAYLKLTKKLGKPSDMEEDDYADAITAYEEAMPEADEDSLL